MDAQFEKRFEEFAERTEKDLAEIKLRIDDLWNFRTMLVGASLAISILSSALVTVVYLYFDVRKP